MYASYSQKEVGLINDHALSRTARNSHYLVTRLKRSSTLKGHTGCVNSVSWNESGTQLVSGSDDCHLNFYDSASRTIWHRIHTSHLSNIFSAKFLPWSSDLQVVSCAGVGTVEHTQLSPDGEYVGHQFHCHTSLTYQVGTIPASPNEFLTCEEKGYVRMFDLRVKSSCHCHGCMQDVLYDFPSAVTCMAVHPLSSHYVAIAVGDGTLKLLDRRKIGVALTETSPYNMTQDSTHYKYRPECIGIEPRKITSVQFNHVGSELLVSYSEDYVYLFNSGLFGTGSTHSSAIPKPVYLSDSYMYSPLVCRKRSHQAQTKLLSSMPSIEPSGGADLPVVQNSSSNDEPPPVKKFRLRGDWSDTGPNARPDGSPELRESSRPSHSLMSRMSQMFARWIDISLSPEEGEASEGSENVPRVNTSLTSSNSSNDSSFQLFATDEEEISRTHPAENQESELNQSSVDHAQHVEEAAIVPTDSSFSDGVKKCNLSPVDRNEVAATSCVSSTCLVEEPETAIPTINIIEGETDSDDEDDAQSQNWKSQLRAQEVPESGTVKSGKQEFTDCLQPFMIYKGHRNSRTMIKQASFWGDNWIMSGSDCGRVFVWDKWSGQIVNMLEADSHVVNCIQPHPHAYLLATSGIDYDVKLWEPTADVPCCLDNKEDVVKRNETMLRENRNTITVPSMFVFRILSYLNRRRRMHRDLEEEDEDSPND
ncbi:DDB1- and CUL4-associated factor 6-like isoform X2 [Halichondria panicea]|uniref:DDB1- and CUL4-associated factor 6-like isoform X2 n=1 Tax=Halichondria panicea TaxID=6063 RepID=UPI00312B5349